MSNDVVSTESKHRSELPRTYTTAELARLAGVNRKVLYGAIHRGELKAYLPNRRHYQVREEDARAWLDSTQYVPRAEENR